ncbi:MAG: cyclic nucleotide-binding domain-containing protein [Pseudomonadota bacterium]
MNVPAAIDTLRAFERVVDTASVAAELATLLGRAPLFSDFTREDVDALYLLLIVRGEVEILKHSQQRELQHMTSVAAGTTVGEMSMMDGEPRFATCRTTQATTFSVLTRANMSTLMLERPQLGSKVLMQLISLLSARLRHTSAKLMRYMED